MELKIAQALNLLIWCASQYGAKAAGESPKTIKQNVAIALRDLRDAEAEDTDLIMALVKQ